MEFIFNVAICDDDEIFVDKLSGIVLDIMNRNGYNCNLEKLYNGKELLAVCRKNAMDIILADIDMPQINGFKAIETLQEIQPNLAVIFVTAHNEYAYQAYDYHPYQFVNKNDLEKLDTVLASLAKKIICRKTYNEIAHIFLNEVFDINVNEVMYFKSRKNYVDAYNVDGSITEYRTTIKDMYNQLEKTGFIYVQRSYILNCRFVDDFDSKFITLKNGEKISMSRDVETRKKAQRNYGNFMRSLRW